MHWTPNAWKKENGGASSFPRLSPSSLEQPVFSLSERSTRSSAKRWEIHFSFSIGYFCLGGKYEYGERRENSSFLVGCTHCPDAGREKGRRDKASNLYFYNTALNDNSFLANKCSETGRKSKSFCSRPDWRFFVMKYLILLLEERFDLILFPRPSETGVMTRISDDQPGTFFNFIQLTNWLTIVY